MTNEMSLAGEKIKADVRAWIERQGYPLEMAVAHAFRRSGPAVIEQTIYYPDQVSGEMREIDIFALWIGLARGTRGQTWLNTIFAVECKSNVAPWVFFMQPPSDPPSWDIEVALRLTPRVNVDKALNRTLLENITPEAEDVLEGWGPAAYQVTEKRNPDKGGSDKAYDAVRQAASSAIGGLREHKSYTGKNVTPSFAFPVVVTKSPLFECHLDTDAHIQLIGIPACTTLVRLPGTSWPIPVRVVNESALDSLVHDCQVITHGLTVHSP